MNNMWIERWNQGKTRWHEDQGNALLKKHWRATGRRILVPLCGKSVDLVWLAMQGNEVTGVELSDLAVSQFFADNDLPFSLYDGPLTAYVANSKPITIYCGDYFDFHVAASLKKFDAIYDRGALIALPPATRARYAKHSDSLLQDDAYRLVVTVEYDQSVADGPPYSVAPEEIQSYWPDLVRVEVNEDIDNAPPRFREAGLGEMREVVWMSKT